MKKLLVAAALGMASLSQAGDLTGEWLCRVEVTSNGITVKSELRKHFADDGSMYIDNESTYYFGGSRPNIEVVSRSPAEWELGEDRLTLNYGESELLSANEVLPTTLDRRPVEVPADQVLVPTGHTETQRFRFDGSRIFFIGAAPNDLKCFKQNVQ